MGGLTANGNSLSIVRGDSGTLCLDLYMGSDLFNLTFGDRGAKDAAAASAVSAGFSAAQAHGIGGIV